MWFEFLSIIFHTKFTESCLWRVSNLDHCSLLIYVYMAITDSYLLWHGLCFKVIFQRPVVSVAERSAEKLCLVYICLDRGWINNIPCTGWKLYATSPPRWFFYTVLRIIDQNLYVYSFLESLLCVKTFQQWKSKPFPF